MISEQISCKDRPACKLQIESLFLFNSQFSHISDADKYSGYQQKVAFAKNPLKSIKSPASINLSFKLIYSGFPDSNLNYGITDFKRQMVFWQTTDKTQLNSEKSLWDQSCQL